MCHHQQIQTIDGMARRPPREGVNLNHPITNDLCVHTMDIEPIGRIDIAEETYERDDE